MSPQADFVVSNGTGAAVRSDINNQLAAIVSNSSGATEPTTMYAYQWWADTTTGLLKIRNAANNAWITVGTLASTNLGLLASGGTLVSALGSASTPGITFTGDLNTGIYSPGADQVSIATSGSDRLSVDASGNVTINAQGDLRFADSDSSNWVAFQAPGTVASNVTWTLPSADGTSGQALTTNGSGTLSWASAAAAKISVGNTEAEVVDTGVDGHFKVTTEGTERLRVTAAGLVGIGTTSPSFISGSGLEIYDSSVPRLKLTNSTTGTGSSDGLDIHINNTDANIVVRENFPLILWTNNTERARIDSSGRLLIGTSSARSNFFNGTNSAGLQIEGASGDASRLSMVRSDGSGGPTLILGRQNSGTIGGNSAVTVSSSFLGGVSFQGNDGSEFVEAAAIYCETDATCSANDMPGRLVFSTTADGASSPTERMRIASGGNTDVFSDNDTLISRTSVGAGTTRSTFIGAHSATTSQNGTISCRIYSNGNIVNTNNSYGSISDIKLKENIVDAASQWSDIKALQVRKYNFKEETGQQTHTQIGLIAQEAELVSPGLVNESTDRDAEGNDLGTVTKSVNYSVLYMKAVKALQEAMERIEVLEQRLTDAGIA
jgi:hypothetical protein